MFMDYKANINVYTIKSNYRFSVDLVKISMTYFLTRSYKRLWIAKDILNRTNSYIIL